MKIRIANQIMALFLTAGIGIAGMSGCGPAGNESVSEASVGVADSEVVDSKAANSEAADLESADSEAANSEAAEKETADMAQLGEVSSMQFTFTDDLGREIIMEKPHRVAVLNASYGEIWALAGGVDTLVGVSSNTWTDVDIPLGDDVVDLGPAHEISLEKLLSCEPDLVLASSDITKDVENLEIYEKAGLNVVYFGATDYTDYLRMLKVCTDLTGCTDNYASYGTAMEQQIAKALEKADGQSPKVLYVRATTGGVKVKNSEGTVLGKMLKDLGCVNIADTEESLLEELSMEKIIDQDPDFIFAVYMGKDTVEIEKQMEQNLFSNGAWSTLTAVKENRYFLMESELYNLKPNHRWGEAYEKLAGILYE